ncbi:MAG: GlsB/YeaQ/YmgE family stress response membrane protein [Polyangiaceae bacterium]
MTFLPLPPAKSPCAKAICLAAARAPHTRAVAGGSRGGFVVSVLLGFLGALLGTWVARMTHLPEVVMVDIGGHPFPIVWSIVGGMILVAIAHALTRPPWIGRRHVP